MLSQTLLRIGKNKPALFLDRDGVLIKVEKGKYVRSVHDIEWIDGSRMALLRMQSWDIDIVVVSNQQCVGLGLVTPAELNKITTRISADCYCAITKYYYCPHTEANNCHCRKPRIGLFTQAMRELGIDPHASLMVGDTEKDIMAARLAGIQPVFVRSGIGKNPLKNDVPEFDNLWNAIPYIEKWFGKVFAE